MQYASSRAASIVLGTLTVVQLSVPAASWAQQYPQAAQELYHGELEETIIGVPEESRYAQPAQPQYEYRNPAPQGGWFNAQQEHAQPAPARYPTQAQQSGYVPQGNHPVQPYYAQSAATGAPYMVPAPSAQQSPPPQCFQTYGTPTQIIIMAAPASPAAAPAPVQQEAEAPAQPEATKPSFMGSLLGLGQFLPGRTGATMTQLQPMLDAWLNRSKK